MLSELILLCPSYREGERKSIPNTSGRNGELRSLTQSTNRMIRIYGIQLGVKGNVTIRDLNKFLAQSREPDTPRGSDSTKVDTPSFSRQSSKGSMSRNLRNATSTATDANVDIGDEG
jgi:hypothetical protein